MIFNKDIIKIEKWIEMYNKQFAHVENNKQHVEEWFRVKF